MSNCILGLLENTESQSEYKIDNKFTKHADNKHYRSNLVCRNAKPLYYFEVYRCNDKSTQIHCLLEDASIIIFNKSNKKIITLLIAELGTINNYIETISRDRVSNMELVNLYRCAKLNKVTGACKVDQNNEFDKEKLSNYMERKNNILKYTKKVDKSH